MNVSERMRSNPVPATYSQKGTSQASTQATWDVSFYCVVTPPFRAEQAHHVGATLVAAFQMI